MKRYTATAFKTISMVVGALFFSGIIAGFIDRKKFKNSNHKPYGFYEAHFKRTMDFICGILVLIMFWPLYIIIAFFVEVKLGTPILFVQERPGLDEKIFKLYKFRTMTNEKDKNGELFPDEIRLTKFGQWLRSSSLDELPEVFNIIKGDMSFIGPRPLLIKYLPYYNEQQHHRHDVKPGLSGYAQTHGRNAVSWENKFEMDVEYTKKITFLGDIKIIIDTILTVLKKEGISSQTSATMEDFADYIMKKESNEI